MSHGVTYEEMRLLLQEEIWEGEGEVLTTLGEVKVVEGADGPIVKVVVTGGEEDTHPVPVIVSGEILRREEYCKEVLVQTDDGVVSEFPFDYPALAVPTALSTW